MTVSSLVGTTFWKADLPTYFSRVFLENPAKRRWWLATVRPLTATDSLSPANPEVKLDQLPRMADFAACVTAYEEGLGLARRAFLEAYERNRTEAQSLALEVSPLYQPLRALVGIGFCGTTADLLARLNKLVSDDTRARATGPRPRMPSAMPLGGWLETCARRESSLSLAGPITAASDSCRCGWLTSRNHRQHRQRPHKAGN